MDHRQHAAKMRSTGLREAHTDLLGSNVARLYQIEGHMDLLFQRILVARDENELSDAAERLDELILAYPDLRLPQIAAHPQATRALLAHLDLDRGPLPGFQHAMTRLCELCLTPHSLRKLRSQLYTVVARVSIERPELLPTAALAALSVRLPSPPQNHFTEMVVCASAIEWAFSTVPRDGPTASLDVSTWLIAEPSARLFAAVGKDRAHYYASIPGVLPFLDPNRILFDVRRLVPPSSTHVTLGARTLDDLADPGYTRRLRTEIERLQGTLRKRYPAPSIADIEMLTHRALEALDDLPAQVNPLLQAIWIQSWVRHLSSSDRAEERYRAPQ